MYGPALTLSRIHPAPADTSLLLLLVCLAFYKGHLSYGR